MPFGMTEVTKLAFYDEAFGNQAHLLSTLA